MKLKNIVIKLEKVEKVVGFKDVKTTLEI